MTLTESTHHVLADMQKLARWLKGATASLFIFAVCASQAGAHSWEALYAFGDSYTDSGAGYIDGNGPTAVVYLAEALNIPFTYVGDPDSRGKGLNFAVSGAQTGKGDGIRMRPATAECGSSAEALLDRGMQTQVLDFSQRVRSGALHFDPEKTLFFLAGGGNDEDLTSIIPNLEGEVQALYELGARYVMVAVLPAKLFHTDIGPYNALNKSISSIPRHLQPTLPGIHILVSRWGEYYEDVFNNPRKYRITNTSDRCAGRALFGEDPTPCKNPDAYFFFHKGHPSTAVHRIVGLKLAREVRQEFP